MVLVGLQVNDDAVICGLQAVPVTLVMPNGAGLATTSRIRLNVSSGMKRTPADAKPA